MLAMVVLGMKDAHDAAGGADVDNGNDIDNDDVIMTLIQILSLIVV